MCVCVFFFFWGGGFRHLVFRASVLRGFTTFLMLGCCTAVQGFGVQGLGFWALGIREKGLGFWVWGLGIRV